MTATNIELWGWQKEFFADTSRIVVAVGGVGSGKSLVACLKAIAFCKQFPGAFVVIARKSRESLRKSTLVMMDNLVANDDSIRHMPSRSMYVFDNGSIILYVGAKDRQQREAIRSISADMIIWEEVTAGFERSDYYEFITRLRGKAGTFQQFIFVTNPGPSTHWLKEDLIDTGIAKVFVSYPHENPHLDQTYLDSLNMLSNKEYRRFVLVEWIGDEAEVYPDFDARIHIIDPQKFIDEHGPIEELDGRRWKWYGAVDWGGAVPTSFGIWLYDKREDILYLYKEIYKVQLFTPDLIDMVNKILEDEGNKKLEYVVADHAVTDCKLLEAAGFSVIKAVKDIQTGIKLVGNRFRQRLDGKRGVYIFSNSLAHEPDEYCTKRRLPYNLITEISQYANATDAYGNPTGLPKQINDHSVDMQRYITMQVDLIKIGGHAIKPSMLEAKRREWRDKKNWIERAQDRRAAKGLS